MKIAFMVIAHTDADQLNNLVTRLAPNEFFESVFFIHVDAKTNIAQFERISDKDYVRFTHKRINVVRCGITQVEAALTIMDTVVACQEKFDRYVLITGQDYPIISNKELYERLSADIEYMRCYKVTGSAMNNKVRRYYFYNKYLVGTRFKDIARRGIQFLFRPFTKKDTVSINNLECSVYYSSAYFAVGYDLFCELYKKGKNKEYFKYFKTAITSDEMYFATIAANSCFRDKLEIVDNPSHTLLDNSAITYFDYQDRPITFTESDYDRLCASGKMFARKFSSIESKGLINKLNTKG